MSINQRKFWPVAGLSGQFKNELPRPAYLEQASKLANVRQLAA